MRRNGVVLARCGDIDAWMRTHFDGECQPELEALRKENAALREENKLLRHYCTACSHLNQSADFVHSHFTSLSACKSPKSG
jgi:hypothetical protein